MAKSRKKILTSGESSKLKKKKRKTAKQNQQIAQLVTAQVQKTDGIDLLTSHVASSLVGERKVKRTAAEPDAAKEPVRYTDKEGFEYSTYVPSASVPTKQKPKKKLSAKQKRRKEAWVARGELYSEKLEERADKTITNRSMMKEISKEYD